MSRKVRLIIFLLCIILLIIIFAGFKAFGILSVSDLNQKNKQLNDKIATATEITSIEYSSNIQTLEDTYENCKIQKQKYEEIADYASSDKQGIYETKQYDIGYLWKTVGKYATAYNLVISMDIKKASGENLYDLYFKVTGSYVNTSEFIAAIENDSNLYFRIYDFSMSGSSETVNTTFTVKEVNIDPSTITSTTGNDNNNNNNSEK